MDNKVFTVISLSEMEDGQEGLINSFDCGAILQKRLQALNIRINKKVKKISSNPFCGPIVFEIGGSRIAIGHGMAKKILVRIEPI